MILKKSDLHFNKFKEDLMANCPPNSHESFVQGHQYILSSFFNSLEGCILVDLVEPGIYDFNVTEYTEFLMDHLTYETSHIKIHQYPKFLEGIHYGLMEATRLLELVAIESENSIAA